MSGVRTKFYADIMACHPEVTGSCNLVVVKYPDGSSTKFIVDCGLFQEEEYAKYNSQLNFDADSLDFVLITHNHIDHVGRLPFLVKKGFSHNIYMTDITEKLIGLALNDSYKVLRSIAKREDTVALYSEDDVHNALSKMVGCKYNQKIQITPNIEVTFLSNGHLLGAAMILVRISYPEYEDINILFTGDYNNKNIFFNVMPVSEEIKSLPLTIVQESTYGNMDTCEIKECYEQNIVKAILEEKSIISPVFSLGRAQEILYIIKMLQERKKVPKSIPIYLDGKLAIKYTNLYLNGDFEMKEEMRDFLPENLTYVDKENRHEVLYDNYSKIILTTSGMGSYGPAQTYIPEYLSRKNALIHFTGYTADGTLGSKLKNTLKGETVSVGGLIVIKRADVEYTTEFSAHAKADEMLSFLRQFKNLRMVLVNHGEKDVKEIFAKRLVKEVETKNVGILGREYLFRIDSYGLVKTMGTKFK